MTIAPIFDRIEIGSGRATLIYAFFGVLSAVFFVLNTRHGIGILPDSTRYMQISPVPYDAPLYSWLLQLGWVTGIGYDVIAYSANFLLYIANTIILLFLINIVVRHKVYLLILAGFLITLVPQFIRAHTVAMSEPLFMFFILGTALMVARFIESGDMRALIVAGVALGLCMLTRFTAAPFALAFATMLLISDRSWSVGCRIRNIVVLAGVSGSLFAVWAIGSELLIGRSTGRSLAFNGNPDAERWLSGIDSLSAFMMPTLVPAVLRYPLVAGILMLVAYTTLRAGMRVARDGAGARSDVLTLIFGLSIVWYAAFLILSVNIEANLPINGRYLLPAYLAIVVVIFSALSNLASSRTPQILEYIILAFVGVVIAADAGRAASQTREAFLEGIGYQGPKWRHSPTVLAVEQLPADARIFSNAPDAINYLTGRRALLIPRKFERRIGVKNSRAPYSEQLAAMKSVIQQDNAYVVFIDNVDWRFYLATEDELRRDAELQAIQTYSDGRIYGR